MLDSLWREAQLRYVRELMKEQSRQQAVEHLIHRSELLEEMPSPTGYDPTVMPRVREKIKHWQNSPKARTQIELGLNKNSVKQDAAIALQTHLVTFDGLERIDMAISKGQRDRMRLFNDLDWMRARKNRLTQSCADIVTMASQKQLAGPRL